MERLRSMVNQIAYTPLSCRRRLANLSTLQLSLIPLLFFTSSIYKLILSLRHHLYHFSLLPKHRLPVPVISVGNLTWGGNGKTPMVEFLAHWLADSGISPLILTRGYGGADEAKMLQRHFDGTSTKIGVGSNRAATAACFLKKYGHMDPCNIICLERFFSEKNIGSPLDSSKIGIAILDDGMQILEEEIKVIESTIREVNRSVPVYYTRMTPSYLFNAGNISCQLPLEIIHNRTVLCVSAIGSANSFVLSIEKVRPIYVDRLDFSDHHLLQIEDIEKIRMRLQKLQLKFASKPIVVITEKDYDRDPEFYRHLDPFEVIVLCSKLHILPHNGCSDGTFKKSMKQLLEGFYLARS